MTKAHEVHEVEVFDEMHWVYGDTPEAQCGELETIYVVTVEDQMDYGRTLALAGFKDEQTARAFAADVIGSLSEYSIWIDTLRVVTPATDRAVLAKMVVDALSPESDDEDAECDDDEDDEWDSDAFLRR